MSEDFLSPKSDVIFKLLFGDERSLELLTDFLKSVLRLPHDEYDEVTLIDPHLKREYDGDKLGILDVRVRTKTKKTIDVEIQLLPSPELRERVVYYAAKMVTEQVGAGDSYSQIKRVISIIITDYVLVPENKEYHNHYTLYDPETHSEFTDIIEVNTLELAKLPEVGDGTELWAWMKFLSARSKEELNMLAERSPQVKKAVVRLLELSNDERTRLLYESRQKMEWDNRAREQGAKAEGRAEGRAEGQNEEKFAIAKNLLEMDMPTDKIVTATGLTHKEIERLRNTD
jgi:predicted transposase/invertase (TIGR01784 family)